MPEAFRTTALMVAVYIVDAVRLAEGVSTAVVPEYEIFPVMIVAPCLRVYDVVVIVKGSIGTLNVAETDLFSKTLISPFAGLVDIMEGAAIVPAIKFQL